METLGSTFPPPLFLKKVYINVFLGGVGGGCFPFFDCISCTSDHSPLPALYEVTLAHACSFLHSSSYPRASWKSILKLTCKLYPAFKVFPYVMSGIGNKNAKQRTECLKEIGRVVVYAVVTLAFSINLIVIVIY